MRMTKWLAGAVVVVNFSMAANLWGGDPGCCIEDPHQRAGNPQHVSCLAIPSNNASYVGYYVGGGSPLPRCADARCVNEGTWGWDYRGFLIPRRVILGWWHGSHYQGGVEGYKTDGPRHEPPGE
jgi:hypothetical protein